jgi:hypothetical protein
MRYKIIIKRNQGKNEKMGIIKPPNPIMYTPPEHY